MAIDFRGSFWILCGNFAGLVVLTLSLHLLVQSRMYAPIRTSFRMRTFKCDLSWEMLDLLLIGLSVSFTLEVEFEFTT